MRRYALGFTLLLFVACGGRGVPVDSAPPTSPAAAVTDAAALMKRAYDLHFDEEEYNAAIDAYDDVATLHPSSPEAPEALFRIANIHHWEEPKLGDAIAAYERVIAAYPASEPAVESIVRIGECHALLGDPGAGVARCDEVLKGYPDSVHVPFAIFTKANLLRYDLRNPKASKQLYDRLRDDYPDTKYGGEARKQLASLLRAPGGRARNQRDERRKIKGYERILTQATDYQQRATAQYGIVLGRLRLGDYVDGIRQGEILLRDYADIDDDRLAKAHVLIETMCERLGRQEDAREWSRKRLANHANSESAELMRRRLATDTRRMKPPVMSISPADVEPRVIEDPTAYLGELVRLEPFARQEGPVVGGHVEESWWAERQLYTPTWKRLADHLAVGGGRRILFDAAAALVDSPDAEARYVGLRVVVDIGSQLGRRRASEKWRRDAFDVVSRVATTEDDPRVMRILAFAPVSLKAPEGIPFVRAIALKADRKTKESALIALGLLGRGFPGELDGITPFLVERLDVELDNMQSGSGDTASVAIRALGRFDDRRALKAIQEAFRRYPTKLAHACARAARQMSELKAGRDVRGAPYPLKPLEVRAARKLLRAAGGDTNPFDEANTRVSER